MQWVYFTMIPPFSELSECFCMWGWLTVVVVVAAGSYH